MNPREQQPSSVQESAPAGSCTVQSVVGLSIMRPAAHFTISVPPTTWRDVVAGVWSDIILPALMFACAYTGFIVALRFGFKFVVSP